MTKRRGHLYRGGARTREERAFERRYGARGGRKRRGGRYVYGATVGKVARERAGKRGGEMRERIRPHYERRNGHRFRVRGHFAIVHAERHPRGHHKGRCGTSCRAGRMPHHHRRRR